MKELKFRVWDKRFKQFIDDKNYESDEIIFAWTPFGILSPQDYQNDIEIQQFTGLKDKNNKDIYEGDIVNFIKRGVTHGPEREYIKEAEVWYSIEDLQYIFGRYNNNGYAWHYSMADDLFDFEVVGNILENPELLK